MAAEPEAPMPGTQGADYCFHSLYEQSCIQTDYRGAATRWTAAEMTARNELALIASDTRFKA